MYHTPKISIIIATHNSSEHLSECLDSILTQSFEDIEVLVVDVCSADGTGELLSEAARKDERVVFLSDNMGSIGHAKNLALDRVRAPYVMLVEPEDCLSSDALEYFSNALGDDAEADLLACETDCFGDDSSGRTNADRKRIMAEANRKDGRKRAVENRLMRSWAFDFFAVYRTDYLRNNGIRHYEEPGFGRQDAAFRFLAMAKAVPKLSVAVRYEKRLEPAGALITDEKTVTDVCREFRFLKRELQKDMELWRQMRLIYWQAYYDRNMLLYEMLSDSLRTKLSGRMQADIKEAIYHKEFSREYFDITVRDEMELLLKSADEFDSFQREKLLMRRTERAETLLKEGRQSSMLFGETGTEPERLTGEEVERMEEIRRKYRLNRKWLREEMAHDMGPLRMLLGLTADEMGELIGVSGSTYRELESGKKEVSWDQYLALLFVFRFNDRTSAVVDTLGLYPEPLQIRMKKGVVSIYA